MKFISEFERLHSITDPWGLWDALDENGGMAPALASLFPCIKEDTVTLAEEARVSNYSNEVNLIDFMERLDTESTDFMLVLRNSDTDIETHLFATKGEVHGFINKQLPRDCDIVDVVHLGKSMEACDFDKVARRLHI